MTTDNPFGFDGERFKAAAKNLVETVDEMEAKADEILGSPRWEEPTLCPRCDVVREPQFAALSRVRPQVYICNRCGDHEAMLDHLGEPLPERDAWPVVLVEEPE